MERPFATRMARPVISAMLATLRIFKGFGSLARKNPFSTPNIPAVTTASSDRTKARAAYAVPKPTSP